MYAFLFLNFVYRFKAFMYNLMYQLSMIQSRGFYYLQREGWGGGGGLQIYIDGILSSKLRLSEVIMLLIDKPLKLSTEQGPLLVSIERSDDWELHAYSCFQTCHQLHRVFSGCLGEHEAVYPYVFISSRVCSFYGIDLLYKRQIGDKYFAVHKGYICFYV